MTTFQEQIAAIRAILPEDSRVRGLVDHWEWLNAEVWAGELRPLWFQCSLTAYGRCVGTFEAASRVISVHPALWKCETDAVWKRVLEHEACHQRQAERHLDLNAAVGPRGRWTDVSHRCPSWAKAVDEWLLRFDPEVFAPVWHRSTGNVWHPWVPDSSDWMRWRRVSPDDTFDGRRLLSFEQSYSGPAWRVWSEIESMREKDPALRRGQIQI